jgi:hypothetical protein
VNNLDKLISGSNLNQGIADQVYMKNVETEGGYNAKVSGNIGELTLSSVMSSLPSCYHIIDNVLLQTKKGSTQIDHIIVSPFGIFVVETKNHKGMIFGDCMGRVWTQVLNGKGHFKFYSPVLQNEGHIRNLSKQIRVPENYMSGVIVFTNTEANLQNVNCPFCFTIDQLYDYIVSFDRPIFSERNVIDLIKRIDSVNTDSYMNRQKHIAYVNSKKK